MSKPNPLSKLSDADLVRIAGVARYTLSGYRAEDLLNELRKRAWDFARDEASQRQFQNLLGSVCEVLGAY